MSDSRRPGAHAGEIAQRTEALIESAFVNDSSELETMNSIVDSAIGEIDAARESGKRLGLTTRLAVVDCETGGFFPGDLTCWLHDLRSARARLRLI